METMQDVISAGWTVKRGIIQDAGKFGAEAWYAPIVYDWYQSGDRGEDIGDEGFAAFAYVLDDATRVQFGLSGDVYALLLSESEQGFVYVTDLDREAYLDMVARDSGEEN